jgi:hypothetical protein
MTPYELALFLGPDCYQAYATTRGNIMRKLIDILFWSGVGAWVFKSIRGESREEQLKKIREQRHRDYLEGLKWRKEHGLDGEPE